MIAFKTVNRRALSTISTTLVLSALLSACGGGGSSDGTTPAPVPSTTPTLSVSSSHLTFNEDFAITQTVATATHATGLTVNQSTTGVVTVTTSASGVRVSSSANANGRTTLTITASNGAFNVSTHVAVTVNAINDTPTLTVSTNNISTTGGFSPITVGTTASDDEDVVLTFAVQVSTPGVVRVTTSANAIVLNAISNASGQTTLTVRTTDSAGATAIQTIAVNVIIVPSTAIPTLSVSTALISVREDFMTSLVIRTTATDADSDAITLSVSSSTRLVDAVISTLTNGMSTITLTSVANLNGTATLIVRASDVGGQSTSAEIVVQVTAVNDAPTLTVSTTALTLTEDFATTVSIAITSSDVEGDTLTLSVIESTTGVVTVTTSASGVRVSSSANANGRTILTITVNDGTTNTSTQVAVTVNAVNDTPTLIVSTNNILTTGGFSPITIGTTASDAEDGVLTFAVQVSTTGVVRVTTSVNAIVLNPFSNVSGQTTLTVRTTDSAGLTVMQTIAVNVIIVPSTAIPILSVSTALISVQEDFTTSLVIRTTATDADGDAITLSVSPSMRLVDAVISTLTNGMSTITLTAVANLNGTATLTIRATDVGGQSTSAEIVVQVAAVNDAPTLSVLANNLLILNKNFAGFSTIATATDVDGDTVTLTVTASTTGVITVTTPATNVRVSSSANAVGRTTLTVQATDSGGLSVSEQIVVVVNTPISFTLSTSVVTLSALSSQLNRNVQSINISNPDNQVLRAQFQVTSSGNPIFSANPTPVVSFTTNALMTIATLTSTAQTAQLYFSIAPDQIGTATLTLQLTDLIRSEMSQQTMVVSVRAENVSPGIAQASSIQKLIVHGGHLYANSVITTRTVTSFLTEARALGGHLVNINTVEEHDFMRSTVSGLVSQNAWYGLVLPQLFFPGELFWVTNDSTIAYGFASANGATSLKVYPGHYALNWDVAAGLIANRGSSRPSVFNWTVYSRNANLYFLLGDGGDPTARQALYEFPQGLAPASIMPVYVKAVSGATVRLTGFDLNGDAINTANWSGRDPNGGTVGFSSVYQKSGVQTVDMVYTAPGNFNGQTTVVVTLQVNGLSTTTAIPFTVDALPNIALSTHILTLAEDFTPLVIGTTVTDQGVSGILPFTVRASSTGIVTITTSANAIQLSAVPNVSGRVTLTVQATDLASQTASTLVVVTVQAVNDAPTLTISSNNISVLGGVPITIGTTATDVEDGTLPFSVQASTPNVVSITTSVNAIVLSPITGRSGQTTLTVRVVDSANAIMVQTIAVNVLVLPSATPVLTVSTNLISLQEDFMTSVVIGITATDADPGTLVVTVRSSTHLVNAVISTQGITLSSVANLFGITTLTVHATDAGWLSASTEVVVVVNTVNDTPTLTVSSRTVTLSLASVELSVSASDVEDGILSFSVSTGQGIVNTAITTTSLTIFRLSNSTTQIMLTLRTTDLTGLAVSTIVTVVLPPPLFVITTGIKTLDFAWTAIPTATHYRLHSNPDGVSGFVDLSTTGIVVSPNSTTISQTTAQAIVSLHRYIPRVSNPQYGVGTCDATSCGSSFKHNTVALTNAQLNSLIGRLQASNAGLGNRFGESVSLSGDGNTLAVGAVYEDGSSTGVNGVQDDNSARSAGAVYVFRRNGGVWSQQAYIKASNTGPGDFFGHSVSLSGDGNTLAMGAPGEDSSSTGVNGAQNNNNASKAGAVYVFRFSGGVWSQQAYIKASNTEVDDYFGWSVGLSRDGNTLAVGAPYEDSTSIGVNGAQNNNNARLSGAMYVFRFSGGVWSQQAYIKASNTGVGDTFGWSVSLNSDGNTLAVGVSRENGSSTGVNGAQDNNSASDSGAAYVFRFGGGAWSQQAYIKASNTGVNDEFGQSVSLSSDGNTLAVGAYGEEGSSTGINGAQDDNSAQSAGAVYVFRFGGGVWSQQAYIKASNTEVSDLFGWSVSLSSDGNALVVGARSEDGSAIGVGGNDDNGTSSAGAAYVFEFNNGTWAQQAYIKASDPSISAEFGRSVSLSSDGGFVAVGAPGINNNTGAVYLY